MAMMQVFEQSIQINSSAAVVERYITNYVLMRQWLNPVLRCEPVGDGITDVGGESRFIISIPFLQPTLKSVVIERAPGLIVWQFEGFFHGQDRWECQPIKSGTLLINRFEFEIPNPLISWGFKMFAAPWTKKDMQAQLQRLKQVVERV